MPIKINCDNPIEMKNCNEQKRDEKRAFKRDWMMCEQKAPEGIDFVKIKCSSHSITKICLLTKK